MTEKHTPGPWKVVRECAACYSVQHDHGVNQVEVVCTATTEANAILISAVLDLLEFARRVCYGDSDDGIRPLIAQGKAAIAKVTGEAS